MSFSGMVKEELSRRISTARHCRIAETAALLSAWGRLDESGRLYFQMENDAVVRKYFTMLRKTFNIDKEIFVRENGSQKKGKVYCVELTEPEQVLMVLQSTRLSSEAPSEGGTPGEGDGAGASHGRGGSPLICRNALITQQSCCKRAFIRGAFLAAGSISDPRKSYHFEIVCQEEEKAEQLQEMIRSFSIDAKIVRRKKSYVVYVKEGAQIVDMLAVMEANVALMDLENIRIFKEMRNSVNRQVNCETANINKTVNAAVKQAQDIQYIEETVGLDHLSDALSQMARLRLQYPEATLKELGMMLNPQVGKSGVNHRLRKLSGIAEGLRAGKEELL